MVVTVFLVGMELVRPDIFAVNVAKAALLSAGCVKNLILLAEEGASVANIRFRVNISG